MLLSLAPLLRAVQPQAGERVSINDPRAIGTFVFVELENSDVLRGTILRVADGTLFLQHEVLGDIEVPTSRVIVIRRVVETVTPPAARPPVEPVVEPDKPVQPEIEIIEPETVPEPEEPEARWSSRLEFGLNGSRGNTERLNGQLAFRTTRETEGTRLSFDANWRVNTREGDRTANRVTLNARHDWDLPDTNWTLFVQSGAELDEFREFDVRASGGAGINYRFIEEEDTTLSARVGLGISRDFGITGEESVPEIITGLEFSHQITERQRIAVTGELFPDLEDTGEFRSVVNARWEYRFDTENNVSLALGVEHRYDTQTVNAQNADVDYFMRIVFGF